MTDIIHTMNRKDFAIKTRKKLIEVALPLDAINKASVREKSIRHGHPSTLHLWWARRPLATAIAVIFAQMVDDPSACPEEFPTKAEQDTERKRLFNLIEQLVVWENLTNQELLLQANKEIRRSWRRACEDNDDYPEKERLFNPENLPEFHDPFAGGGALPLEAQRLGLKAHASDLNPIPVLINKAMIEIPPKFAGMPPVNPETKKDNLMFKREWKGSEGLAEDVRFYGTWMRDQAQKRIGNLYPKVEITEEMLKERPDLKQYKGRKLTVVAWIWARTVKSPNPAFSDIHVPLASTFVLSSKSNKEVCIKPIILKGGYRFSVKVGRSDDFESAKAGTKLARGANFRCLISDIPILPEYIKEEGRAGRMGERLMAIVANGDRGKVYIAPIPEHESIVHNAKPEWIPQKQIAHDPRALWTPPYGLTTYGDLFTSRQLVALTTFSDLVNEARAQVMCDAVASEMGDDGIRLNSGGTGVTAYAEAVAMYLGFLVDQQSNQSSTICGWNNINQQMIVTFSRQAIPMVWDFAECNVFSKSTGSLWNLLERQVKAIESLSSVNASGEAFQADVVNQDLSKNKVVSTDPPYYDNIGYADLSDFFYVWLRRSMRAIFPDLLATISVPKTDELIASPYRHKTKQKAEDFFLDRMVQAMGRLSDQVHPLFPVNIYYAFKQSETKVGTGIIQTGWATFLTALIRAGFTITGTWPIKTESANKLKANINVLASSIVLVCRPQKVDAPTTTRREFVTLLRTELSQAINILESSNIAPVDLAQAVIGPGMAIFTRYTKVLNASGNAMEVQDALALINQTLGEILSGQEGDYDQDTRWALTWFEQFGFTEGEYGIAEQLSKSKNTSVEGLVTAGILESSRGKVKLLSPKELSVDWDPLSDTRTPVWEVIHHLVRVLEKDGEKAAGELMSKMGASIQESAKELAYRLYNICERKNWSEIAFQYNALIQSWSGITQIAQQERQADQTSLF